MDNTISFAPLHSFSLQISYHDIDSHSTLNQLEHHVHRECEIYLNLSGDVSFMVEDQIYPVSAGSVIITRPYEYHHCIYHSNERHRHYWILFSADNNEKMLDMFFNRAAGQKNFLMIVPSKLDRFIYILEKLRCSELPQITYYRYFFELLEILNESKYIRQRRLGAAIGYLNSGKSVTEACFNSGFSDCSKFIALFKKAFGMTPLKYKKKFSQQ